VNLQIVNWAARECERQGSGEMSVYHMCNAWYYTTGRYDRPIFMDDILILGKLVEPVKNANGFRNTPVTAGGNVMLAPRLIKDVLFKITEHQPRIGEREIVREGTHINLADEWYRQFEEIHPFIDGNGRTGNILWNWLMGTLHEPKDPPNFWEDN
jgi:Fic/DOC family